ncbi:MAG: SDR family oxidoreductase [Actinobacteria bacterium]|nr:SDR family oxidoreductase [Actinomycetota bacterium]
MGAATARRLAEAGAKVVVLGRRREPLETVAADVGGVAVSGDASIPADARRAVNVAIETFGRLDVLVANAGGEGVGAVHEADDAAWAAAIQSNLTSAFVSVRESLPRLLETRGRIVIVSSVAALGTGPEMAGYVTAKTALVGLTRSLAVDYGPSGVRVNAVCPGWVRTPMADREMDDLGGRHGIAREDAYALATAHVPLRRAADPDEIAAVVVFLASDASSYVTGSVLVADGGHTVVDVGTLAFGSPSQTDASREI